MIRAVILITLAACASSHSAEQHSEVAQETHAEQQATQSVQQETHSEEGEWTRRTWEFVGPVAPEGHVVMPPNPSDTATVKAQYPSEANTAVVHPSFLGWPMDGDAPIVRYTEETHAPAHVDTTTVAGATQATKQDTSLKAASEAHSASKWKVGLPWLLLLAGALAAAAGLWLARGKLKLALEAIRALMG